MLILRSWRSPGRKHEFWNPLPLHSRTSKAVARRETVIDSFYVVPHHQDTVASSLGTSKGHGNGGCGGWWGSCWVDSCTASGEKWDSVCGGGCARDGGETTPSSCSFHQLSLDGDLQAAATTLRSASRQQKNYWGCNQGQQSPTRSMEKVLVLVLVASSFFTRDIGVLLL